jgi:biotin carboxyl carrier protein
MAKFRINLHGNESEVEVIRQGDRLHVTRDRITAELRLLRQDGYSFVLEWPQQNGERRQIRGAGRVDGDQRQLWVNGRTFNYDRVRQRNSEAVLDGSLSSSIPAVVSQVLVNLGETVSAGDKLILLESMKMIIPILAPCDSKVVAIHCAAEESVQAGVPLIELEKFQP